MDVNSNSRAISSAIYKVGLAVVVTGFISLFLYYLGSSTNKETEVVTTFDSFEVKGMFGGTYSFDKVTGIELRDTVPAIGKKTNGSGLGEVRKGSYEVDGLGECRLYILSDNGPFLYVLVDGKYVIMNYKDKDKTKRLYNDLYSAWKKID